MKPYLLILVWLVVGVLFFASKSVADCPEDPYDSGICDSLYVEVWTGDQFFDPPGPEFVRFPIYFTHDVPDPYIDSVAAFVIPLCYTHTNPSKYCSVSSYWNKITWGSSDLPRSVFRHLPDMSNPVVHNWMMDQFEEGNNEQWNSIILSLDGTSHFWLAAVTTGYEDQKLGPGSRILLATVTFKLQDSMMICMDSCLWPPASNLAFLKADANTYVPRHNLPVCERVRICVNMGPYFTVCPGVQAHPGNGHFISEFSAVDGSDCANLTSVQANFQGAGVENVRVVYVYPPPSPVLNGYVEYDVTDHCQPSGTMSLVVENEVAAKDTCSFGINLVNAAPELSVPDSIFTRANYSTVFAVSADDQIQDSADIGLNAFWYAQDSLRSPINPPSYQGNNPGSFEWIATNADTGVWFSLFSAIDVCGKADSGLVTILVGPTFCGDLTQDTLIDVADVIYLINYLFRGGIVPEPTCRGDVNCSGDADIGDVVYLINYLYKSGTAPCFGCCG